MSEVFLSYIDILRLRRDVEIKEGVSPVVFSESTIDDNYIFYFNYESTKVACKINPSNKEDFEANILPFCNKINFPVPDQINSHDFCDNTLWDNASSLYVFEPTQGFQARLTKILGVLDPGVGLSSQRYLQMTSWFSINGTTPCPDLPGQGTPTDFGTPLFNPSEDIFTGWVKIEKDAHQDYVTWLHFTNGVKDYGLRHYKWDSTNKLKLRAASFKSLVDPLTGLDKEWNIQYNFFNNNDYFCLRSSLKERLEAWVNDNQELGQSNNVASMFAVYFSLYSEW